MEKMAWDGPKWGREDFFLANPGLANILGRTDLDFENFYFFHFLDPKFLDFQVPRFPKSGLGRAWALGRPWAGLAREECEDLRLAAHTLADHIFRRWKVFSEHVWATLWQQY